jgi:gliding motility-associated-like protein
VYDSYFSPAKAGPGTHTLTYTVNAATTCGSGQATVQVVPRIVDAGSDTVVCGRNTRFELKDGTPAGGFWAGEGVTPTGWFDASRVNFGTGVRSCLISYTYGTPGGICPNTDYRVITIIPDPNPKAPAGPAACAFTPDLNGIVPFTITFPFPQELMNGSSIFFDAEATWDFGDGKSTTSPRPTDYTYNYTEPGNYQPVLTVRYGSGCVGQVRFPLLRLGTSIHLPNIITPNHDGQNDYFVQQFGCHATLRIYSRWGIEVYRSPDYQNNWDGGTQAAGTYYYFLQTDDGRTTKGWLEIVR